MANIFMKPSFNTTFVNQRVIQDRRSHPTSFVSTLRFGGRRKKFPRDGEGHNQYVDRPSLRTVVLTFISVALSILGEAIGVRKQSVSGSNRCRKQSVSGLDMRHLFMVDVVVSCPDRCESNGKVVFITSRQGGTRSGRFF